MLIKLNMLTVGTKYILCCESYPFLPKSFLFSCIKLIYTFYLQLQNGIEAAEEHEYLKTYVATKKN